VVVKTKEQAREEFSRNLNKALDQVEAPKRGRPEWLRKEVSGIVSRETCRKWLSGLDIPDEGHMSVLADRFSLNIQHLRTGKWEPSPGSRDARFAELERAWPNLDDTIRDAIIGVVRAVKPTTPAKSAVQKRRQG
jgi:hypothetical protein